jgi:cbb3-type cytochrome oxidase maturation protein
MGVIIFLALAAIITAAGFLAAFIWATRTGQFDDTYTPAVRILFDTDHSHEKNEKLSENPAKD